MNNTTTSARLINFAALETVSRWITAEQEAEDDASSCLASACFVVGAESVLVRLARLGGFDMPEEAMRIFALTREGLADLHVNPLPPEAHRRALAELLAEITAVIVAGGEQ